LVECLSVCAVDDYHVDLFFIHRMRRRASSFRYKNHFLGVGDGDQPLDSDTFASISPRMGLELSLR
jgi:hypothetical protein